MRDEGVYLAHILECIRRIEVLTLEGRETFMTSFLHQDAILRNLQTMSESTQRLSSEAKGLHPEVEWRKISAFRNVLTHDYLGVNLRLVWEIIQRDVPQLKRAAEALAQEHGR